MTAVAKSAQRGFTLRLCPVGVDSIHFILARREQSREALGAAPRPREDEHPLVTFGFEQMQQQRRL